MPSRRSGGGGTTKRKHSLGNLRRAHPASGATWNVQVVRGKMSSKCLWHACRALILGLTLMLLGAGMATLGYYADHLSMGSELRGNVTVRVKNDLKGFHLNNFAYVGPIVMGFGGFIVVASCVMTFEARDSAAKVVPARLRAGGGGSTKNPSRSNQGSSASQRRGMGAQYQSSRWDQHFGVFRSSPGDPHQQPQSALISATHPHPHAHPHIQQQQQPFDREALTAELVKFSRSLSSVRRVRQVRPGSGSNSNPSGGGGGGAGGAGSSSSARIISNSSSLIQRATRECSLLQPPAASRVYWQASSFDGGSHPPPGSGISSGAERRSERNKRSDTAKRHVLARQRPIEQEEARDHSRSPLGHRRNSTMSDSSYSGRWTARCASIASRTSSIESRRVQVDLHSPEVMPKSILRSPKRYSSGPSATPSVEKEFRSQLSVCSEPPPPVRQLSGQSSMEPAVPEESLDQSEEQETTTSQPKTSYEEITELQHHTSTLPPKKVRPGFLPLARSEQDEQDQRPVAAPLYRSNSSRQFYRPKKEVPNERDDSVFYIRSMERGLAGNGGSASADEQMYDSLRVINERRTTLLKADSQSSLGSAERKLSSFSLKMPEITERENSIEIEMDADEPPLRAPPPPPPPIPPSSPPPPPSTAKILNEDS
ncbi:actin cytoskeleton-regulatory complex protein pan1 isoform X3 [Drosophila elegans]|uniref:actin cytoskeleton-regulatory complex protein pan1 isoform X3 n=1 Tax=Drosophila elegans TaxID=30023 RepID=UPI0007E85419|nr:actin cytoskeleton-regulatory complex protein pan1 isoform X3 [Drosophila elegans]